MSPSDIEIDNDKVKWATCIFIVQSSIGGDLLWLKFLEWYSDDITTNNRACENAQKSFHRITTTQPSTPTTKLLTVYRTNDRDWVVVNLVLGIIC